VSASWNGATDVASWRVLVGSGEDRLQPVTTVARDGFETTVVVDRQRYAAVVALDAAGTPLATSPTVAVAGV